MTSIAELLIAFQLVVTPLGAIVIAFDVGFGGGGAVGAAVWAREYVESRAIRVINRGMRGMKLRGSRK